MSRREEIRLRDILAAIGTIRAHLSGGEFDRKTSDAVLYNLVVSPAIRLRSLVVAATFADYDKWTKSTYSTKTTSTGIVQRRWPRRNC